MCSVFRRRISHQITSRLRPFLKGKENLEFYDLIPLSIKLNQPKGSPPCLELCWKDVLKLKPDLQEKIHPTTVMTYLKNQEFPTVDGFTNISLDKSDKNEKFVFTAEQELFTSSVLQDISNSIETIPSKSTFFKSIFPQTVIVEYSSPNIAKPFHYGHFRSTIMGNFIANICQYVGHDVTSINYIGDWGLQYGILAVGYNQFGSEEKLSQDPLGHLFEVYREANEKNENDPNFSEMARNYFQKMEQGDKEALNLWRKLCEISLEKMKEMYFRLNIKFDETHRESMYAEKCKEVLDLLLQKGVAHTNVDGSIQTNSLDSQGEEENIILRKSDGTSLYLSRDIAAAIDRYKNYIFDEMYYVVDSSQSKHFTNLKNILKSMDFPWESNIHHIPFGRISNFSTRKGTAVFLNDILNEARERTLEKMRESPNTKVTTNFEEVADVLGISSLIINDFSNRRKKDLKFSWDRVLSMTEDSGTTLQYCHARICSIKEKCGLEVITKWDLKSLKEQEAISLISHLAKFDEVIYNAYITKEPCVLVHYLFGLRIELGRAIKALPVIGSSPNTARARLVLFHATQLILKKSFEILGITPLSKM